MPELSPGSPLLSRKNTDRGLLPCSLLVLALGHANDCLYLLFELLYCERTAIFVVQIECVKLLPESVQTACQRAIFVVQIIYAELLPGSVQTACQRKNSL